MSHEPLGCTRRAKASSVFEVFTRDFMSADDGYAIQAIQFNFIPGKIVQAR